MSLKLSLTVLHFLGDSCSFSNTQRHLQFHLRALQQFARSLAAVDIHFLCFTLIHTHNTPAAAPPGAAAAAAAASAAAAAENKAKMQKILEQLNPAVAVCDQMPLR